MSEIAHVPGEPHQWCPNKAKIIQDGALKGLSPRSIAHRAGISVSTMYRHYRDAYEVGMGDNESVLLGTMQRNAQQKDNLNASNTASAFLLERRHGYNEQVGVDLNINDEAETEAVLESLRAKAETMMRAPLQLDRQLAILQNKVTTGDFNGDLDAFKAAVAALSAPSAAEVENSGTAVTPETPETPPHGAEHGTPETRAEKPEYKKGVNGKKKPPMPGVH